MGQDPASSLSPSLVTSFWEVGSWSSRAGLSLPPLASLSVGALYSCSRTACAMGTIMAVVAVLLIHMDRKAVTNMKPRINLGTDRGTLQEVDTQHATHPGSQVLVCGNSQGRPHPNDEKHVEGDAFVEIPVLYGDGHHQPPDEQDVGVCKVLSADLEGRHSSDAGRGLPCAPGLRGSIH